MTVLLLHILPVVVLAVVCIVIFPINTVLSLDSDSYTKTSTQNTQQQQQKQQQFKDNISKDDYLAIGLDKIEPAYSTFNGLMYAGLLTTSELLYTDIDDEYNNDDNTDEATTTNTNNNNNNGQLMFWYFEPTIPLYNDTIVIWLNGGPGCSSLGGCLFEHCPVTIPLHPSGYYSMDGTDPFILLPNNYSWTQTTKMLYVEQPQGTGFSTSTASTNGEQQRIPQNETDVAIDFYNFLQNFYYLFTELSTTNTKLYIFGESYAGMYVPSIAHYIYEQNELSIHPYINIQGIGLGNGWIDVSIQGPSVIEYAHWHGMIDSNTAHALHNEWYNCQSGHATTTTTNNNNSTSTSTRTYNEFHEFTVPDECGIMSAVLNAAGANQVSWGSPNSYDIATWDKYFMLDDPNGKMASFYNNPLVQKALNVPVGTFWIECLPGAGRRLDDLPGKTLLAHDKPESVVPYIAELLDKANIQVLIYNGDRDMTTNAYGSEVVLDNMIWDGANGWHDNEQYQRGLWLPRRYTDSNTTVGGYMKQYNNLQFLIVVQSGHLVPYNRPQVALEIITRFLGNESFIDKELPKYTIPKKKSNEMASLSSKDFNQTFIATSTTNIPVSHEKNNDQQKRYTDDSAISAESIKNAEIVEASASELADRRKHPIFYHHITTALIMIIIAIVFFIFGLLLGNKQYKQREGYQYVANAATAI